MAAGFFVKALSSLLSTASRWVEFADGSTAPTHGTILLDPSTGLPLNSSSPAPVSADDGSVVTVGAKTDAAASDDTGTFSLVSLAKRGLQNWTALLARIPSALVSDALPVIAFPQPSKLGLSATIIASTTAGDQQISVAQTGATTKVYAARFRIYAATVFQIKTSAIVMEEWTISAAMIPTGGYYEINLPYRGGVPYYVGGSNATFRYNSSAAVKIEGLVEFLRNAL